jgi:hypothetical protein
MEALGNILALTAEDRIRATTGWFRGSEGNPWAIIPLAIAVGAAVVVLAVIAWRRHRVSRAWQLFHEEAARLGMTKGEQEMLRYVVKAAGLQNPQTVLTTEGLFQEEAAALVASEKFASLKKETRQELTAIIKSAREKLGFAFAVAADNTNVTSRQIPRGASVSLTVPGLDDPLEAPVNDADDAGFVVGLNLRAGLIGRECQVRYPSRNSVWEFTCEIADVGAGSVKLRHAEQVRFINRRKFARVKTERQALVAGLPFMSDNSKLDGPRSVPGMLLEIAGPGFLIQAQGQFSVGEKIVVMVKFQDKEVVSGVGKVRRVQSVANGESSIGGELIDLDPQELSKMVRETHAAARQGAAPSEQTPAS